MLDKFNYTEMWDLMTTNRMSVEKWNELEGEMNKTYKKELNNKLYHINKIIDKLSTENKILISDNQREKINKIFELIFVNLSAINKFIKKDINMEKERHRLISIRYLLKRIFQHLDIPSDYIEVSKQQKTREFNQRYWSDIWFILGGNICDITAN